MTGTLPFDQQRQANQQDWLIDRFCLKKGIRRRDLERHPCWQDLVILIQLRCEFDQELHSDRSLIATYNAFWGMVYAEKKSLKPKSLIKLEIITERCIKLRQQHQLARQTIKALRGVGQNQNTGHDMTAKGPNLPEKVSIREPQGGREDLGVPWD